MIRNRLGSSPFGRAGTVWSGRRAYSGALGRRNTGSIDRVAVAMFVLAGLVVAGLAIVLVAVRQPAINGDLCAAGQDPPGHVIYFVDPTNQIPDSACAAMRNDVGRRVASLQRGERLTILALVLGAKGLVTATLFSRCHPGSGRGANGVASNRRLEQKRFEEQFQQPLEEALDQLEGLQEAERSPILEELHAIAMRPDFSPDIPRRVLTIYSDLLQHSEVWSDYQGKKAAVRDRKRLYDTAYLSEMRDALVGVEVRVYQLSRGGAPRPPADHQGFWHDYFALTGATVEFTRL